MISFDISLISYGSQTKPHPRNCTISLYRGRIRTSLKPQSFFLSCILINYEWVFFFKNIFICLSFIVQFIAISFVQVLICWPIVHIESIRPCRRGKHLLDAVVIVVIARFGFCWWSFALYLHFHFLHSTYKKNQLSSEKKIPFRTSGRRKSKYHKKSWEKSKYIWAIVKIRSFTSFTVEKRQPQLSFNMFRISLFSCPR